MGEVVLRRIQGGVETTRGTAVAATKKLYGTQTLTYAQPHRFAVEDRGNYADKWRGNPKLIETGMTLVADATFEDVPYYADTFLRGGVVPTGSAGAGYTWAYLPDVNSDTLGTRTYEVGDDQVAWQGPFGTTDTADFTLALDDALSMSLGIFTQNWVVQNADPSYGSTFNGFTGSLTDRAVESVMGWQARLFVDPDGTSSGTTQVTGRFIAATWGYHNQNKRKYFGDGAPIFTKLGRGRRQTHCQITFEGADTAQFANFAGSNKLAVRIGLFGTGITGTSLGTTTAATINAGTVTSIPTLALSAAIPGGVGISVGGNTFVVTVAGAALNATSIPVQSQVLNQQIAASQTVMAAKTQLYDFWGLYDTFVIGNRDTNTTFAMDLQSMVSIAAGQEAKVTVVNGSSTL